MKIKITFEQDGREWDGEIEGRDYQHIIKKAKRRIQYRRHIYDDMNIQIVKVELLER